MADGIQGLLDFVGYPVADPHNVGPPPVGIYGLLDFTGIPYGDPNNVGPPPVGIYGLLDFTGIPYGDPNNVPTTTGKAKGAAGGRRLVRYLLAQEEHRSLLDHARQNARQEALALFRARVEERWGEYQRELARQRDNTIFAALLAEV